MQTFLPYPSFVDSARCLDNKRLGKQRVEAYQIIRLLRGIPNQSGKIRVGWLNHPAVLMWKGFDVALECYKNCCIREWIRRGFNNTMAVEEICEDNLVLPIWFGREDFHSSHRSNLLRKNIEYYSKYGWSEPADLPYVWPVASVSIKKGK